MITQKMAGSSDDSVVLRRSLARRSGVCSLLFDCDKLERLGD
jgi:hypothetical protein